MLEFDLWRFSESDSDDIARLKSIVAGGKAASERSNRDAVEFLIRSIGLRTLHTRDEGCYTEAANYVRAPTCPSRSRS